MPRKWCDGMSPHLRQGCLEAFVVASLYWSDQALIFCTNCQPATAFHRCQGHKSTMLPICGEAVRRSECLITFLAAAPPRHDDCQQIAMHGCSRWKCAIVLVSAERAVALQVGHGTWRQGHCAAAAAGTAQRAAEEDRLEEGAVARTQAQGHAAPPGWPVSGRQRQ